VIKIAVKFSQIYHSMLYKNLWIGLYLQSTFLDSTRTLFRTSRAQKSYLYDPCLSSLQFAWSARDQGPRTKPCQNISFLSFFQAFQLDICNLEPFNNKMSS